MQTQVKNDKGFLIIKCSKGELRTIGDQGICDSCNKKDSQDGYYIAVLNWWVCPECYKNWLARAEKYSEDTDVEKRNYDRFLQRLTIISN
jgi:hypothetical protein